MTVLHPRDVAAATAGGADRLLLLTSPSLGGRTPSLPEVSAAVKETDLPVRVLLRYDDSLEARPADFQRFVDFGRAALELGAAGFAFGFLDRDLEVDRPSCAALAAELPVPWTFHRGFDAALEPHRAWRDVLTLPLVDAVASAGSTRGFATGGADLLDRVAQSPDVARLLMVCGGLTTEEIPWLVRAGVRHFALGEEVRPDRSWDKAYVDRDYVRSWRMLLDDALMKALGIPVD